MKNLNDESISREFQDGLNRIMEQNLAPLERLQAIIAYVRKSLEKLRSQVKDHIFTDSHAEIRFFKQVKPEIYSQMLFALSQFTIENNLPLGQAAQLISYYEEELKTIQRFFQANAFHYQYYKLGFTELDQQYFIRNNAVKLFFTEAPIGDPQFSTEMDYLFAKFMAQEQLQQFILERIRKLTTPISDRNFAAKPAGRLQWTGDGINLVELAYGIWLTGQLNHGNATITEIIEFLEDTLNIKIGRPFRRWTEITQRKQMSPTRFIDQLREALHTRIDNELMVKDQKRRVVK